MRTFYFPTTISSASILPQPYNSKKNHYFIKLVFRDLGEIPSAVSQRPSLKFYK